MTEQDPLIGTLVAERYRIDAKIGSGGMGAVYRGEHVAMRKPVAIKVLHHAMTTMSEAVKRFEREAIAAGRIDHPNVVGATDFGRLPDGAFFLVLEYVAGDTLVKRLKADGAMPLERAVSVASQIVSALQAAHEQGIVHRDLKPENVMLVTQPGGSEQVKVLDFGIAKIEAAEETQLTQLGSVFGTPQYMSPEQAAGAEVDHRADLYALGLILYEMLSGHPPFKHHQVAVLLAKQLTEQPPPLPEHIPEHIRHLVSSLLEKSAEDRPQSAREAYDQLRQEAPKPAPEPTEPRASRDLLLERSEKAIQATVAGARRVSDRAAPVVRRVAGAVSRFRVRGVRVWPFGAGALLLSLGGTYLSDEEDPAPKQASSSPTKSVPKDPPSAPRVAPAKPPRALPKRADPELKRILSLARRGSEPAVYALEQRDDDERGAKEWLALGIGRLRLEKIKPALAAFEEAIDAEPTSAADETLLGGLRYVGGREEAPNLEVLTFAAERLGSHGADLLFDVWSSTSRKTKATEMAREFLDRSKVRASMSPALKLGLELRATKSCEGRKKLMPRLAQFGDERSIIPMRAMARTRGCGSDKKDDCYPCLREDSEFKDALTQVAMRNAPRYEWRR